jgi:hypothetical protein
MAGRLEGYAFDTVDASRASINLGQLVVPTEPESSLLYLVLVSPGGDSTTDDFPPRMPYDEPMANRDIDLVYHWIQDGADGL